MPKRLFTGTIAMSLVLVLLAACAQQDGPGREVALTDAPKFGKFIWHDLITDDVERAKSFYGPLLGWSFEETERPSGGPYTLIVSSEGQYVGGMVALDDPDGEEDYSRWLAYYAVPDVDQAAEDTVAAGGQLLARPRDAGVVARVAAVRDPQGAVVGLIRSKIGYPVDQLALGTGDVAWNELITAEPAGAAEFYAGLSRSEVRETQRSGVMVTMLHNEGRHRASVLQRPDEQVQPLWLTYFAVPDAATAAGRARDLGGSVLVEASEDVRDGNVALVIDPSGAVFGVQRSGS